MIECSLQNMHSSQASEINIKATWKATATANQGQMIHIKYQISKYKHKKYIKATEILHMWIMVSGIQCFGGHGNLRLQYEGVHLKFDKGDLFLFINPSSCKRELFIIILVKSHHKNNQ